MAKMRNAGFLLFLFLCVWISVASAQDGEAHTEENMQSLTVSIVVDVSGSMKETDPDRMRVTATQILVEQLGESDRVGVIAFESDAKEVQDMKPVGDVGKEAIKNKISDALGKEEGDTDYRKALVLAKEQLDKDETDNRKIVLFLTDGTPDPGDREEGESVDEKYMAELWEDIRKMGDEGYPIYTVGFGEFDEELLTQIAEETQGVSTGFSSAGAIAKEFFQITSALKNRQIFLDRDLKMFVQNKGFEVVCGLGNQKMKWKKSV